MDSKRFHGKLLELYRGKEILRHVLEQAQRIDIPSMDVWVATDSEVISSKVIDWGGKVFKSRPGLNNGTERVAEFSRAIPKDYYVNVQGDDPTISLEVISKTVENLIDNKFQVVTPCYKVTDESVFMDANKVKLVKKVSNSVIYFSRSPIPNVAAFQNSEKNLERVDNSNFLGHIGVYGYTYEALQFYSALPESSLERSEKLEQLRFIENGIDIGTFLIDFKPSAVDSPKDLQELNGLKQ